jgi:hypothetical protein
VLRKLGAAQNDQIRYDGQDALCLSIEWPNWSLFWKFRQSDANRHWAILQIKHEVLWTKNVCFNTTNAADNSMSSQTFHARQGKDKFLEMFADHGAKQRAGLQIPDYYTTNHQAEVLCLDNLDPSYISHIHLLDTDLYNKYNKLYPGGYVTYGSQYFRPRTDWSHWKNG